MRPSTPSQLRLEAPIPALRPQLVPPAVNAPHASRHFSRALHDETEQPALSSRQKIREALLLLLCDPIPAECLRLERLTRREWQEALHWLDVSGLALYFLDRLQQENLTALLPDEAHARLRQNLADNTARTAALLADSADLHSAFQNAGLSYATLKGFSLGPLSVPKLELRSQLDFDFLVAESSAAQARAILEARGFRLCKIHGRSWEFSAHNADPLTLRDLYKPVPHRYVELHIEPSNSPLLVRVQMQHLHGLCMPVLSPADLFIGQGLHIFKHLRYEVTRPSHLVEFRRHVIARTHDIHFWREVHVRAGQDPRPSIGLGVVLLLIDRLMGDFAPLALTTWTAGRLSPALRVWVETCAHRAILTPPPGTKLYLLLQEALAATSDANAPSPRRALIPRIVNPGTAAHPNETRAAGRQRRWHNLHSFFVRARFHLIEVTHYLRESRRFRKQLARLNAPAGTRTDSVTDSVTVS